MKFVLFLGGVLLLALSSQAKDFNLKKEMVGAYCGGQCGQAGGSVVIKLHGNKFWAERQKSLAQAPQEEKKRRLEAYEVLSKVNFARRKVELPFAKPGLAVTKMHEDLFKKFALSDYGAVWLRKVVDDNMRLFNGGYLNVNMSEGIVSRLKMGGDVFFSEILAGGVTEDAVMEDDYMLKPVFIIASFPGTRVYSFSGGIAIGRTEFGKYFCFSGEKVDPLAIVSHEFGHTRFADPLSGDSSSYTDAQALLSEAKVVREYENPVRHRNGYPEREVYYSPKRGKFANVHSKHIFYKDGRPADGSRASASVAGFRNKCKK